MFPWPDGEVPEVFHQHKDTLSLAFTEGRLPALRNDNDKIQSGEKI